MSTRRTAVAFLLLVGAALAGWFWPTAHDVAPSAAAPAPTVPAAQPTAATPAAANVAREAADLATDGDPTAEGGGTLVGRVLDRADQPLQDAVVTVLSGSPASEAGSVATDAAGWFRFAGVPPGSHRVRAIATGCCAATSGAVRVQEGEETQVDTLRLAPGCTLRGIVVGAAEEPIAGANVRAGNERATSGADGRFEMANLAIGPVVVDVRADGWLSWHRDAVDPATELRVVLAAGLVLTGSVHDAATGAGVVRYAVRALRLQSLRDVQQGTPAWQLQQRIEKLQSGAAARDEVARAADERMVAEYGERLVALQRALLPPSRAPTELPNNEDHVDGRFTIDRLDEGLYVVEVLAPDHVFVRSEPIVLRAGTSVSPVRLAVRAGAALAGTVRDQAGKPIDGVRLQLIRPGAPAADSPLRWLVGQSPPPGDIVAAAASDRTGAFTLPCVLPGDYALLAWHADYCATSRRTSAGANTEAPRIVLAARPSLRGRVRGIPAGRNGDVAVLALGGASNLRSARVDEQGQYTLERLEPGEYTIRAVLGDADVQAANLLRTLFTDAARAPARDLALAANERKTFDPLLSLPPMGTLQGSVQRNGAPAPGCRISLLAPGSARPLATVTDPAGTFQLRDVPAGECELRVAVRAGSTQELWRETINIAAGVATTVHPMLSTGSITGRVVASDGAQPNDLAGDLLLLPDCASMPNDLAAYRRTHRVHQLSVRAGAVRADVVSAGRSLALLRLRNRETAVTTIDVPAGGTTEIDLTAGAMRR